MISIDLDQDGRGIVSLPTRTVQIAGGSLADGRDQAIRVIHHHARETHAPAEATVVGSPGVLLTVHPDGHVEEGAAQTAPAQPPMPTHAPTQGLPPIPSAQPAPAQPEVQPTPPASTGYADTGDGGLVLGPDTDPQPIQEPIQEQAAPAQPTPAAQSFSAPLTSGSFVKETTPAPQEGVQAAIYKLTGGLWNLGPGAAERYRSELHERASKPIQGTRNVTFMCLKGGISKTSTTLGVGLTLAEHRPDAVLALDANPDAGDLADRALSHEQVEAVSPRTITDLVNAIEAGQIHNLTDLNRFTQTSGRLHLIAGEQDPAVSESLTAEEYIDVREVVDRFYPITLTDCGTGVTHPAMRGILENAQQIVVASGWAVTGAKRAERTLTWLHQAHNGAYSELARNAVVVLTETGTTNKDINREQIVSTLGQLCREVHLVPFDPEVAKGDLVRLSDLRPQTQQAYLEIGATIIDGL